MGAFAAATFYTLLSQYLDVIQQESTKQNLDPALVAAVIYVESRADRKACYRGAHGLMQIQIRPRSCRLSKRRAVAMGLYNPRANIRRGVKLMAWWKQWWEHNRQGLGYHWLLHYNQGFGSCRGGKKKCRWRDRSVVTSGKVGGYARRVLRVYYRLKFELYLQHQT